MRQRVYLDTSLYGGYFDDEFSRYAILLFERIRKNEFVILYSAATQDELENAPVEVEVEVYLTPSHLSRLER